MTPERMPTVAKSKRPPLSARKKAFSVHPTSRAKFLMWNGELFLYKHGLKREPVRFGPALILSVAGGTVVFEWYTSTGRLREFIMRRSISSRRDMHQLINAGYEGCMDGEVYLDDLITAFNAVSARMSYAGLYERFMPHIPLEAA